MSKPDSVILPDQLINSSLTLGESIFAEDPINMSMGIEENFDKIVNELHYPGPSAVAPGLCFHCGGTITAVKKEFIPMGKY